MTGTSESDGGGRSGPLPTPQFFCPTPTPLAIFPSPQPSTGSALKTRYENMFTRSPKNTPALQATRCTKMIFYISTLSMYFILSLLMTIYRAICGSESSDNKRQLKIKPEDNKPRYFQLKQSTEQTTSSPSFAHTVMRNAKEKCLTSLGRDAKKDKWKNWGRAGNYTNKYF